MKAQNPIGVFDSGIGGLTVYKALQDILPHEDFVYLGDTARLPYGTKSSETVANYAKQAAEFLLQDDIKLLVVACNTASALALTQLQKALPNLPCIGVIEPGAAAAAQATKNNRIAVWATASTVQSGAYPAAIKKQQPAADIQALACNLLVALVEEGWCEGQEAEAVLQRYLSQLEDGYDTLLLGCTHFPLLTDALRKLTKANLVDSATTAAEAVKVFLTAQNGLNMQTKAGKSCFYVTDSPQRFAHVAHRFLTRDILSDIRLANLLPDSHDARLEPLKAAKVS